MTVATTLTRRELYDRVWQTPMVKLAAEYGISGRGLAKLCERHAIPVPGRGHWAVTKAGYVIERDPLPADPPPDTAIQITGDPEPAKDEHSEVAARIAYEAQHPIVVPDQLNRPHRLVSSAREILRPRKANGIGTLWTKGCPLNVSVSPKQLPRALRIFDSLLKACEERGFSVTDGNEHDSSAKIKVHGEELKISIQERSKRTSHAPTRREEEEQRLGRGWGIPQYDYAPSGLFILTIDEYTHGLRHRWSDRDKRPLESRLNEIIVALVRISVTVLTPRRIEAERRHQLWLEEEERRRIYWAKMEALEKNLKQWQENQQLRAFIAAVETAATQRLGAIPDDSSVAGWLRWAHHLADRNDPLGQFLSGLTNEKSKPSGDL